MMRRLLTIFALALAARSALPAEPLGRLFLSPLQRAQLDRARDEKKNVAPSRIEAPPAPPAPLTQTLSYGGIVRRSDGRRTLWINNRMVDDKEALTGLDLRGHIRADGTVAIEVSDSDRPAEVKVGQSLDVADGKILEGSLQGVSSRDGGTARRQPGDDADRKGSDKRRSTGAAPAMDRQR